MKQHPGRGKFWAQPPLWHAGIPWNSMEKVNQGWAWASFQMHLMPAGVGVRPQRVPWGAGAPYPRGGSTRGRTEQAGSIGGTKRCARPVLLSCQKRRKISFLEEKHLPELWCSTAAQHVPCWPWSQPEATELGPAHVVQSREAARCLWEDSHHLPSSLWRDTCT